MAKVNIFDFGAVKLNAAPYLLAPLTSVLKYKSKTLHMKFYELAKKFLIEVLSLQTYTLKSNSLVLNGSNSLDSVFGMIFICVSGIVVFNSNFLKLNRLCSFCLGISMPQDSCEFISVQAIMLHTSWPVRTLFTPL